MIHTCGPILNVDFRLRPETHRSSRQQRHNLVMGHTVKFGQILALPEKLA